MGFWITDTLERMAKEAGAELPFFIVWNREKRGISGRLSCHEQGLLLTYFGFYDMVREDIGCPSALICHR